MDQEHVSAGAADGATEGRGIPVAVMVESIVGCKWSVSLLQLCAQGHSRPSTFLRACAGLSAKVMNERLRKMMRFGILARSVRGEKPPLQVDYLLTPFGHRFVHVLDEVRRLQDAVDTGAVPAAAQAVEDGDTPPSQDRPPQRLAGHGAGRS